MHSICPLLNEAAAFETVSVLCASSQTVLPETILVTKQPLEKSPPPTLLETQNKYKLP